ncbi:NUDIX domain-containing protein [Varunaivibrio sulfuroxidans]|nr:NUDIX domain-containing protein [Varunaivibrio sulfuroxidans]
MDDVEIIDKTRAFQGYFAVDRYHLRHRLFDGGWSEPIHREVFERGHAVAVLLFDPARDVLVFVEQFRPGAFAALRAGESLAGGAPWLIECVAGIVEKGESPEDVARREAFEEAHCEIDDLIPISRYFVSPGGGSETVALYCGLTQAPENGSLHGLAEEHEDIRVLCLDASAAVSRLEQGGFSNALTLIAMQWFALNRVSLRKNGS